MTTELQEAIDRKRAINHAAKRKLDDRQRLAIRLAYASTDATISDLAREYGVAYGTIHAILKGETEAK